MKKLLLFCILFTATAACQAQSKTLVTGDNVPMFSLLNQDGKEFDMAKEAGKSVLVIYFYPKDESMVYTKEACAFRDSFDQFTKAGAKVIGINGGTVASHKEFEQHYKLPFVRRKQIPASVASLYSATKAAVDALTISLSKELGARNIRVNSILRALRKRKVLCERTCGARAARERYMFI